MSSNMSDRSYNERDLGDQKGQLCNIIAKHPDQQSIPRHMNSDSMDFSGGTKGPALGIKNAHHDPLTPMDHREIRNSCASHIRNRFTAKQSGRVSAEKENIQPECQNRKRGHTHCHNLNLGGQLERLRFSGVSSTPSINEYPTQSARLPVNNMVGATVASNEPELSNRGQGHIYPQSNVSFTVRHASQDDVQSTLSARVNGFRTKAGHVNITNESIMQRYITGNKGHHIHHESHKGEGDVTFNESLLAMLHDMRSKSQKSCGISSKPRNIQEGKTGCRYQSSSVHLMKVPVIIKQYENIYMRAATYHDKMLHAKLPGDPPGETCDYSRRRFHARIELSSENKLGSSNEQHQQRSAGLGYRCTVSRHPFLARTRDSVLASNVAYNPKKDNLVDNDLAGTQKPGFARALREGLYTPTRAVITRLRKPKLSSTSTRTTPKSFHTSSSTVAAVLRMTDNELNYHPEVLRDKRVLFAKPKRTDEPELLQHLVVEPLATWEKTIIAYFLRIVYPCVISLPGLVNWNVVYWYYSQTPNEVHNAFYCKFELIRNLFGEKYVAGFFIARELYEESF